MASAQPIQTKDVNADAPFRSPEHAIRAAFRAEADDVVAVSSYFADIRGGTVRLPREETDGDPYNAHAQAGMLFGFMERTLKTEEWLVIRARHTIPKRGMLEMRKQADVDLVFQWFIARTDRHWFSLAYARDAVRGWCMYGQEHDDDWWSVELERSVGTLRGWRNGDRRRNRAGFMQPVEATYGYAIGKLVEPMFQCGLTQE